MDPITIISLLAAAGLAFSINIGGDHSQEATVGTKTEQTQQVEKEDDSVIELDLEGIEGDVEVSRLQEDNVIQGEEVILDESVVEATTTTGDVEVVRQQGEKSVQSDRIDNVTTNEGISNFQLIALLVFSLIVGLLIPSPLWSRPKKDKEG